LDGVFESFRYGLGERHDEVTIECSGDAGERVESVAGAAAFFESRDHRLCRAHPLGEFTPTQLCFGAKVVDH